jgi:hypothetical protein
LRPALSKLKKPCEDNKKARIEAGFVCLVALEAENHPHSCGIPSALTHMVFLTKSQNVMLQTLKQLS